MKKLIKKNWLLIAALLFVGGLVGQKVVSAYQTSWLPTYTSTYYYNGKFHSNGANQGAYFGWNGALQSNQTAGWAQQGQYQVYAVSYRYPNAWRV